MGIRLKGDNFSEGGGETFLVGRDIVQSCLDKWDNLLAPDQSHLGRIRPDPQHACKRGTCASRRTYNFPMSFSQGAKNLTSTRKVWVGRRWCNIDCLRPSLLPFLNSSHTLPWLSPPPLLSSLPPPLPRRHGHRMGGGYN